MRRSQQELLINGSLTVTAIVMGIGMCKICYRVGLAIGHEIGLQEGYFKGLKEGMKKGIASCSEFVAYARQREKAKDGNRRA
jgi:hypothetical protein